MPPTDDKGRFVAIKLGLYHPDKRTECGCDQKYGEPDNFINEAGNRCHWHKAGPPPDFLSPAGADLLLRTLLKTYSINFGIKSDGHPVFVMVAKGHWSRTGYGDTPAEALLDAAFKALEEK